MPKCVKCEKMVPPQFTFQVIGHENDPKALECSFCHRGVDAIETNDGTKYTKKQCIKDYKIFLTKLAEKKNIAEQMIQGKIKQKLP